MICDFFNVCRGVAEAPNQCSDFFAFSIIYNIIIFALLPLKQNLLPFAFLDVRFARVVLQRCIVLELKGSKHSADVKTFWQMLLRKFEIMLKIYIVF